MRNPPGHASVQCITFHLAQIFRLALIKRNAQLIQNMATGFTSFQLFAPQHLTVAAYNVILTSRGIGLVPRSPRRQTGPPTTSRSAILDTRRTFHGYRYLLV